MDTQTKKMASENWIMNAVMENPRTTATAAGATFGLYKFLVYDPYCTKPLMINLISLIFTVTVVAVLPTLAITIDWKGTLDWFSEWLVKMSVAAGSIITTYGVYKRTVRTKRRRKINNARRKE